MYNHVILADGVYNENTITVYNHLVLADGVYNENTITVYNHLVLADGVHNENTITVYNHVVLADGVYNENTITVYNHVVLADGVYNESTITVYNHGRLSFPDGASTDITGAAYLTDETGKLLVDFGFDFLGNCKFVILCRLSIYSMLGLALNFLCSGRLNIRMQRR